MGGDRVYDPQPAFDFEDRLGFEQRAFGGIVIEGEKRSATLPRSQHQPGTPDLVDRMAQLFGNPNFMRFSLGVFTERKQTVAFIEKVIGWDRTGIPSQFAVVPKAEDAVIGYCGFYHHAELPGEVEIGYRLHPDYWNRGLITEAARAVRDHAFADLKLPRVISLIHAENIPSRRVAEKNGMKVEKEIMFRGFPTLVYAISREEWLVNRDAS